MKRIKWKSENFVFVVQNRASQFPDHLAYTFLAENDEPLSLSYAELDKKARAIAGHLQQQNIFSKRVLVLYSTGIEFITAFLGCLYAGAIAVPVSAPRLAEFEKSVDRLKAIAIDADVQCILTESYYVEKVETYFADLLNTKNISLVDSILINTTAIKLYQPPNIEEDTIAYLQYTSGSTSAPKGVVTTHLNLSHSLKFTATAWHYSKKSITLTWAPHSHVYGLVCGLLLPLYHGTPSYIMAPDAFVRRPAAWLHAISTYQVTHSGCPNFGYDLCVQEVDVAQLADLNLKKWVVAVNGGESVQHQTLQNFTQKFAEFGFKPNHFNSAFGMSEATGLIAATPYDSIPEVFDLTLEDLKINKVNLAHQKTPHLKFVSCGKILSGLDITIVNPDTLFPANESEIGEIWLAGDSIADGYFRRPVETQNAFGFKLPGSDYSYFRTGDLGFIREDKLCITGRLKEMIVIRGKKYYPFDIESTVSSVLAALPVNLYRAAFSSSINGNEEVIFLQEVKEGISEDTKNEIIHLTRTAVLERFGIDLHAVILVKSNSLPKTPSGKLQHKKCHEFYEKNKLDIVKSHSHHPKPEKKLQHAMTKNPQHYGEIIRFQAEFLKLIASVLKIDATQINLSDPISAYHFDSINLIQLTNVFNEKFNLTLTPANLFEFTTLEEFFDGLLSKNKHAIVHYYQAKQAEINNVEDIKKYGV